MRPNSPAMDAEIGRQHKVLDHGMVRVVDYMGNDAAIVQAARVSYGSGTKTPSDDRSLIRYLMSHRHSTPFEMCEIKLHVKLPVFVARQWIRHRTANVNEYSARYSILANEFYVPEARDIQPQSKSNAQGREGELPERVKMAMVETIRQQSETAYQVYEELFTGFPWFDPNGTPWDQYSSEEIAQGMAVTTAGDYKTEHGMARELARMVVPPNIYTEWYWKIDLHNLLHFLSLRADPHAQMEIRVYAEVICDLVRQWCPVAFEAFEDYVMNAERFSAMEMEALLAFVQGVDPTVHEVFLKGSRGLDRMSVRERRAFAEKLGIAYD